LQQVARSATRGLWTRRSSIGLVGNHINVQTGDWTHKVRSGGGGGRFLFAAPVLTTVRIGQRRWRRHRLPV
jgi:hypothetical protein